MLLECPSLNRARKEALGYVKSMLKASRIWVYPVTDTLVEAFDHRPEPDELVFAYIVKRLIRDYRDQEVLFFAIREGKLFGVYKTSRGGIKLYEVTPEVDAAIAVLNECQATKVYYCRGSEEVEQILQVATERLISLFGRFVEPEGVDCSLSEDEYQRLLEEEVIESSSFIEVAKRRFNDVWFRITRSPRSKTVAFRLFLLLLLCITVWQVKQNYNLVVRLFNRSFGKSSRGSRPALVLSGWRNAQDALLASWRSVSELKQFIANPSVQQIVFDRGRGIIYVFAEKKEAGGMPSYLFPRGSVRVVHVSSHTVSKGNGMGLLSVSELNRLWKSILSRFTYYNRPACAGVMSLEEEEVPDFLDAVSKGVLPVCVNRLVFTRVRSENEGKSRWMVAVFP